jgi:hypothetical protein
MDVRSLLRTHNGLVSGVSLGSLLGFMFYFAVAQSVEEQTKKADHMGIYATSVTFSCVLGLCILCALVTAVVANVQMFRTGASSTIFSKEMNASRIIVLVLLTLMLIYSSFAASVYSDHDKKPDTSASLNFGLSVTIAGISGLMILGIVMAWLYAQKR